MALRRSIFFDDTFGALNSESLTAEEEYGALGSATLTAEEEYGLTDWYGDDDEDDDEDDDYGAWYGEDDDTDEGDAILDDLESGLDEDVFGAWYGADSDDYYGATLREQVEAKGVSPQALAGVEDAVGVATVILPEALEETETGAGVIDDFIEAATKLGFNSGDYQEIAAYIVAHPDFANWNELSKEQRVDIVKQAVFSGAVPGIEMKYMDAFYDTFDEWYEGGMFSRAKAGMAASLAAGWQLATGDIPRAWGTALGDLPIAGAFAEEFQQVIGQPGYDDMINPYAVSVAVGGVVFPGIYADIADQITKQGQQAISEAKATAEAEEMEVMTLAPAPAPIPQVTAPPEVVPVRQTNMPRPQTILAFGYSALVGGSLLGVFR